MARRISRLSRYHWARTKVIRVGLELPGLELVAEHREWRGRRIQNVRCLAASSDLSPRAVQDRR